MANVSISFTVRPTFRDLEGRFARAEKALLDARRDELRDEGRQMVVMAKRKIEQKTAPYNSTKLQNAIRFNTRQLGNDIRLSVTGPGWARPHRIQARFASALAFFWPRVGMQTFVPKRGGFRTHVRNGALFVGKGYVDHPGGTLKPLIAPILKETGQEWKQQRGRAVLSRISTRYIEELTRGN